MIIYKTGNIFDSKCQTLVNPVNCVGVMGKGLALEFKKRYPFVWKCYSDMHTTQGPYYPFLVKMQEAWVVCFPTKNHFMDKGSLTLIECGLIYMVEYIKLKGIKSIAFPALGCGCGELKWEEVKPMMEKYLSKLDIEVEIYTPHE